MQKSISDTFSEYTHDPNQVFCPNHRLCRGIHHSWIRAPLYALNIELSLISCYISSLVKVESRCVGHHPALSVGQPLRLNFRPPHDPSIGAFKIKHLIVVPNLTISYKFRLAEFPWSTSLRPSLFSHDKGG